MCDRGNRRGSSKDSQSGITKLDIMYYTTCAHYKFETEKQHGGLHSGVSCQSEGGSVHLGECKVYCHVLY